MYPENHKKHQLTTTFLKCELQLTSAVHEHVCTHTASDNIDAVNCVA